MSRLVAWGAAMVMALAAAWLAGRSVGNPASPAPLSAHPPSSELARCRAAGEGALKDPACRRAWDTARARFFGRPAP